MKDERADVSSRRSNKRQLSVCVAVQKIKEANLDYFVRWSFTADWTGDDGGLQAHEKNAIFVFGVDYVKNRNIHRVKLLFFTLT